MTQLNKWNDLTCAVKESMPVWPEQPRTELGMAEKMCEGGVANVTTLSLSLHTGTHVDAPCHFLSGGADIQSMPMALMTGKARVIRVDEAAQHVTKEDVQQFEIRCGDLMPGDRVLFRTRNTAVELMQCSEFCDTYAAIAPDAADYLVEREVALVGVDYLSVAPFDDPTTTHRLLLGAGVWIVEGLDLREISECEGELIVAPLRIKGSDAAPARVLFRQS